MHFHLDEDLSQIIAQITRRLGLDVTSAQELEQHGISDDDQLNFAAADGR